jgi:aspartyl-tRNA(Asn)/glutamyl-tRNA(Gln) amidotransferase subunit B
MTSKYLPTIGLEIHAELKTASKMFCSSKNDPDEEKPNVNICPICLGHPGTLPVLNMEAIKHVLKVGVAVSGTLADFTEWDRKNYFYPDIPKGYQISQHKYPLVSDGALAGVELDRIHLEEDTARSTHDQHEKSLVDFNRSGVPLLELVTKPVIHDAATAVHFAKELQLLLRYLGAGEANLEKGEMRVEANISIASEADTKNKKFGTKTEVKNLNSFRSVERAIEYELGRQTSLLENGESVVQETRGWDDRKGETYSQRSKESSHDYRYFPDPDIPKLKLSELADFSATSLKKSLPELPWQKRERFKKDFDMTDKEVAVFVENDFLRAYFEQALKFLSSDKKKIRLFINYLLTDYTALLKEKIGNSYLHIDTAAIMPVRFVELIDMIAGGKVSSAGAKKILAHMIDDKDASPQVIAEKNNLIQKNDSKSLLPAIEKVIADNAAVVAEYKSGKTASLQYLIGQAMKATEGAGNPEIVRKILLEKLG